MTIYALGSNCPEIADNVWVAPSCHIVGRVLLQSHSSVWFGSTLRGDNELITVGVGSNIQENCVLHTDLGFPLNVGDGCTIGHKSMLHGCKIGPNSLVGMGATILNGAVVGADCLIGAGALITEGKIIPDGSLVVGVPGRVVRSLDDEAKRALKASALHYQTNANRFRDELRAI